MKFNQLTNLKTHKAKKRKGRGIASGLGKTAGRGTKGQKARSGGGVRLHFEGGQTPLVRKLPKLAGFKSHRPKAQVVLSGQLDNLKKNESQIIDSHFLVKTGLIKDAFGSIKLIKKGEVKKAHRVHLPKASKTAILDLKQAGGDFKKTARLKRPTSTKKSERKQSRLKNLQKIKEKTSSKAKKS